MWDRHVIWVWHVCPRSPYGNHRKPGVLEHRRVDPNWEGEDSSAGGRPPELDAGELRVLKKFIHDEVGLAKMTIPYMKKRLKWLRRLTDEGVRRILKRMGYVWRLRRGKAAIAKKYKPQRLLWADWVLKQPQSNLNGYCYVDGTTLYLANTAEQHADKERAALGKYCYRLSTGEDSLEDCNVGASAYAKAQGLPVKIWGFFCNGRLEYFILPKDYTDSGKLTTQHMNGTRYRAMVQKHFAKWRRKCLPGRAKAYIVKDHERFLHSGETVEAEKAAGFLPLPLYPKCSPDLNAIEGWWRKLKLYLEEREPSEQETRDDFIRRLRRAVDHLNAHCRAHGRRLCRNQKERALAVKKLRGARTQW